MVILFKNTRISGSSIIRQNQKSDTSPTGWLRISGGLDYSSVGWMVMCQSFRKIVLSCLLFGCSCC